MSYIDLAIGNVSVCMSGDNICNLAVDHDYRTILSYIEPTQL